MRYLSTPRAALRPLLDGRDDERLAADHVARGEDAGDCRDAMGIAGRIEQESGVAVSRRLNATCSNRFTQRQFRPENELNPWSHNRERSSCSRPTAEPLLSPANSRRVRG
jgi:hypothetical protein